GPRLDLERHGRYACNAERFMDQRFAERALVTGPDGFGHPSGHFGIPVLAEPARQIPTGVQHQHRTCWQRSDEAQPPDRKLPNTQQERDVGAFRAIRRRNLARRLPGELRIEVYAARRVRRRWRAEQVEPMAAGHKANDQRARTVALAADHTPLALYRAFATRTLFDAARPL